MNPKCRCGGHFKSIDPVQPVRWGVQTYYTTIRRTPGVASWQCDKCGVLQEQRLRQPKRAKE